MSNTNADVETKGHQAQVEDVYESDEKTRYADMVRERRVQPNLPV